MEYGTLVLSVKNSLTKDIEPFVGWRTFHDVCTLQVGEFVFQRPDTKKIIIDFGGRLVEETPQNVYLYSEVNRLHFKGLIRKQFQERIDEISGKREKVLGSINEEMLAISKLCQHIDVLALKNQEDFNPNREKEIKGLEKNKRRHESLKQRYIHEAERYAKSLRELEEDRDKSLELADTQIQLPRVKGNGGV